MHYRDRLPFPEYVDSSSVQSVARILSKFFPMIPTIAEVAAVINRINTLNMPTGHHILSGMLLEMDYAAPIAAWMNESPVRLILKCTDENIEMVRHSFSHPEPKFSQFRDAMLADYLLASIRSYCLNTKNEEFDLDQLMDIMNIIGNNHGVRWYSEVENWRKAVPQSNSGPMICELVLRKLCDSYRITPTGERRWKVYHP